MLPEKLQLKLFAAPGQAPPLEDFIPVFHDWIKHKRLAPDLMIDVANYAHVPSGPGVVLIGDAYDIFVDESGGRRGLLHNRKRHAPPPAQRLEDAFRRLVQAAVMVQATGKITFANDQWLLRVNDRLAAPNDAATFARHKEEIETFARKLFEGAPVEVKQIGEPRQLFSVQLTVATPPTLPDLQKRLG